MKSIDKIDDRSRVYFSVEERKQLGKEVVVERKGDKLNFYTKKEWLQWTKKVLRGLRGRVFRKTNRSFFGMVTIKDIGDQGRISIPKNLR